VPKIGHRRFTDRGMADSVQSHKHDPEDHGAPRSLDPQEV
jgi:hypothetical protein